MDLDLAVAVEVSFAERKSENNDQMYDEVNRHVIEFEVSWLS